jgi:hypothetical protein
MGSYVDYGSTYTPVNKDSSRSTALKLYTGEVLKAFTRKNIAMELVSTRTISGGKTAQWIVTGQAADTDVSTHTIGENVAAKVLANDEVTITVSTRYYYSHFVDELDEKLAQYEIRGELSKQAGEALAVKIDKAIFSGIVDMFDEDNWTVRTGQSAPAVEDINTAWDAATTVEAKGNALIEGYFNVRTTFNERDVTAEPTVVTTPQNYYYLVQSTRGVNADYTSNNGGIDSGEVSRIAGLRTVWTNHLPSALQYDRTGDAGAGTAYELQALVFTPDVYGVVKAMDITSESNYLPEKLGHLLTSYYAMGMGGLNGTGLAAIVTTAA